MPLPAALSPNSTSPARYSPQRSMPPTRISTQHHHHYRQSHNVPGIINLPPSSSSPLKGAAALDSTANNHVSTTARHHRGPPSRLVHEAAGDKPLPTLDHSRSTASAQEPKKRRRQPKKAAGMIPEPASSSDENQTVALSIPAPAHDHDRVEVEQQTPTKARRSRRGRANRQTSPPIPEALLLETPSTSERAPVAGEEYPSTFSSTTPPQADSLLSHQESKSVPPELAQNHPGYRSRQHRQFQQHASSGDDWDMPLNGSNGAASAGNSSERFNEPKEGLSWQQELLKASAPPSRQHSVKGNGTSRIRSSGTGSTAVAPRQPTARHSLPAPRAHHHQQHQHQGPVHAHHQSKPKRPTLHPSLSDSNAAGGNPSLNWQQEMLLQTEHLQTSTLSTAVTHNHHNDRRVHSASPTKPSSSVGPAFTASSASKLTPARQRQQRIKDSITFGLNDLDISSADTSPHEEELEPRSHHHVSRHNSVGHNHNQRRHATAITSPHRPSPPTQIVQLESVVTPTKGSSDSLGPRYAGPTFHNSPAPSSLPVPSFVLRRQG